VSNRLDLTLVHEVQRAPLALVISNLISTLVARRHALGMSQATLAHKLRTPQPHLCQLEVQHKQPTLPMLVTWAHVLGFHVRLIGTGRRLPRRPTWR
jgi:hypothetical protein